MKARVMSSLALPAALATAGLLSTAEAAYAGAFGSSTPTASAPYTYQGQPIGGDVTLTSAEAYPCTPIGNVVITDYGHCCTPIGNVTVTDYAYCCTPIGNMTITDYGHCCTPMGNVIICDYGPHQEQVHRHDSNDIHPSQHGRPRVSSSA